MSDESYLLDNNKEVKKEKNWLALIFKVTFILLACVLVGITVLYNMGGSSASLKDSVEKFVSNVFQGRPVEVENLVYMGFFPKMGFDVENIKVLSNQEDKHEIATVGKVQFFMGFWDVAFRVPRISGFYLSDFHAIKGTMGAQEFDIKKVFIDHDAESKTAILRGNGKIGDHPWSFTIDVDVLEAQDFWKTKGNFSYMLPMEFPFTLDIADMHFEGNFLNHESGYYKFKDFELSSGNHKVSGNLVLSALGKRLIKIKGDLQTSADSADITPELIFDYSQEPMKISGEVIENTSIDFLVNRLQEIIAYKAEYQWEEK